MTKIRVEAAPAGRRRAVVFRQASIRVPSVNVIIIIIIVAAVAEAVGHRSPHRCLLHYSAFIVVAVAVIPPVRDAAPSIAVSSRSAQITSETRLVTRLISAAVKLIIFPFSLFVRFSLFLSLSLQSLRTAILFRSLG